MGKVPGCRIWAGEILERAGIGQAADMTGRPKSATDLLQALSSLGRVRASEGRLLQRRPSLCAAGHDAGTTDYRLRSAALRGVTLAPGECISRMSADLLCRAGDEIPSRFQIPISKIFPRPVSISSVFSGVVVGLSAPLCGPSFAALDGPLRGMSPAVSSDEVLPPALRTS